MNEVAVISHSSDILQWRNSRCYWKTNVCVTVTKLGISHHLSSGSWAGELSDKEGRAYKLAVHAQNTAGLTDVNCDELCAWGLKRIHLESKFTDGVWHALRLAPALTSFLNFFIFYWDWHLRWPRESGRRTEWGGREEVKGTKRMDVIPYIWRQYSTK